MKSSVIDGSTKVVICMYCLRLTVEENVEIGYRLRYVSVHIVTVVVCVNRLLRSYNLS